MDPPVNNILLEQTCSTSNSDSGKLSSLSFSKLKRNKTGFVWNSYRCIVSDNCFVYIYSFVKPASRTFESLCETARPLLHLKDQHFHPSSSAVEVAIARAKWKCLSHKILLQMYIARKEALVCLNEFHPVMTLYKKVWSLIIAHCEI